MHATRSPIAPCRHASRRSGARFRPHRQSSSPRASDRDGVRARAVPQCPGSGALRSGRCGRMRVARRILDSRRCCAGTRRSAPCRVRARACCGSRRCSRCSHRRRKKTLWSRSHPVVRGTGYRHVRTTGTTARVRCRAPTARNSAALPAAMRPDNPARSRTWTASRRSPPVPSSDRHAPGPVPRWRHAPESRGCPARPASCRDVRPAGRDAAAALYSNRVLKKCNGRLAAPVRCRVRAAVRRLRAPCPSARRGGAAPAGRSPAPPASSR